VVEFEDGLEGAVFFSVVDDCLGQDGTDSGEEFEFSGGGGVDVEFAVERRGRVWGRGGGGVGGASGWRRGIRRGRGVGRFDGCKGRDAFLEALDGWAGVCGRCAGRSGSGLLRLRCHDGDDRVSSANGGGLTVEGVHGTRADKGTEDG
jgi:hypothetical protein